MDGKVKIGTSVWGRAADGREIRKYRMETADGAVAELSDLGASVVALRVPDRTGRCDDVVLGYDRAEDFAAEGACMGKTPGRYANRIAGGRFTLDGRTYDLPVNNGPNHLHGGPDNFSSRVWQTEVTEDSIVFRLESPDGDNGYPGRLSVSVEYVWQPVSDPAGYQLVIRYRAVSDAPTVVNLTNHTYYNLGGRGGAPVPGHRLWLNASRYLPTDETLIPRGPAEPVAGTPMDFTVARSIGERIREDFPALRYGKGYDNCWVIDREGPGLTAAARLEDPVSGRVLTVFTDQPGIQVYTGNWLAGGADGKAGRPYADYEGVALECQDFPDAPNRPDFPSTVLRPGSKYQRMIVFQFGILTE